MGLGEQARGQAAGGPGSRAGGVAEKECPGRGLWGSLSVPLALSQGAGRLGEAQWYPGRCREPAGVGSFSSDPSHPPAAVRASF